MNQESKQAEQAVGKGKKRTLVILICIILAISFAIAAVIIDRNRKNEYIMTNELVLVGVSVNGIDISGMTKDAALSATAKIEEQLLSAIRIDVDVQGEVHTYTAQDIGVRTDYNSILEQALAYGHTGTLEQRKQAIATARDEGMAFNVSILPDRDAIVSALKPLKAQIDQAPVDASYTFMPWGYLADGTPFEQDPQAMIEAAASGKSWERPDLVRLPAEEMPNKLRYEFWKNDRYVKDYIPADANIARFLYVEEQQGRSVDIEAVADAILAELKGGGHALITAPVEMLEPAVKLADIKHSTQLISSWTSSYSNHPGHGRTWNVAKLSGLINGVVLEPDVEWSINQHAGLRSLAGGWKEAPGISNGGYTQQAGGGVCQISSTLFNAVIRSALTVTDATHHTISSDYIPLGLDATISSPRPDLKFKNPYDTPVYIVSYVNPADKNVTVEIYGPPVVDDELGAVILEFTSQSGGYYGSPRMVYYYNSTTAPDNKVIAPGESYVFAKARKGQRVQTYIHYLDLEGNELKKEKHHYYEWPPINGKTYVNAPDPSLQQPAYAIPTITP